MNRDWPTMGFTFRPYTPWSEPETRSFGKVLKQIRPKWDGGIDLHGQLIDRAFSFTLLGAGEHDYAKNQRILQTVKGAWSDAEAAALLVAADQAEHGREGRPASLRRPVGHRLGHDRLHDDRLLRRLDQLAARPRRATGSTTR